MLVLTRKIDQAIVIGDPKSATPPIEILVSEISGDSVQIGVKAPAEVVVDRKEIWEEKRQAQELEMYEAATLLGLDVEMSSVDFASVAQAEVVLALE